MFLCKSTQNNLQSILQWVKDATSPSCAQLLVCLFVCLFTCSFVFLNVSFQSSVEEARYLLASRRGSLPCVGRNMRRRSLDMVAEEQPSDHRGGDRVTTSLASLRVPRHRNRSRSLDNSLETSNNFAAFKESLKVGWSNPILK